MDEQLQLRNQAINFIHCIAYRLARERGMESAFYLQRCTKAELEEAVQTHLSDADVCLRPIILQTLTRYLCSHWQSTGASHSR